MPNLAQGGTSSCPTCHAEPGQPCVTKDGTVATTVHWPVYVGWPSWAHEDKQIIAVLLETAEKKCPLCKDEHAWCGFSRGLGCVVLECENPHHKEYEESG